MFQHQPADHRVEPALRKRQSVAQVVNGELDGRSARFAAGLGEHPVGEVHGRDGGAPGRQPERMASCAAAQIENFQPAHVADGRPDDRLLQPQERVPVMVVHGSPAVIAPADRSKGIRHGWLPVLGENEAT